MLSGDPARPAAPLRVTVWNENLHETADDTVARRYPDGIHGAVAAALRDHLGQRVRLRTATLREPDHGLGGEVIDTTDVLVWWGHLAHDEVTDEVVERVRRRVLAGMGLVVLHSGHYSRIFRALMGTTCSLRWRNAAERELVWTVAPGHPIAQGVPDPLVIPAQETYSEPFDVPAPEELVFISSFAGGEVFRSGCAYRRGAGRIFYFGPGDQDYPVYHHPDVRRVVANAVLWAAPGPQGAREPVSGEVPAGWFERGQGD
ncbi:ThuA domain-containing protein [Marinactinospora thermotolerans]|uniref:Trehalose utilization protein n=1 Tax=Marinactinospora thermotolerans DSM 45154 TaxID=1122192 RepID=A0A1T4TDB0_9ACTN|nr:ThuA domain-containing protein [Marinactinospora thermotolerans]SKA38397.1 Trehalose utilization protein [Marinactinospora thermotolerans DSM 45154]